MSTTGIKWYKTTGGKLGIVVIIAALATGAYLWVKSKAPKSITDKNSEKEKTAEDETVAETNSNEETAAPTSKYSASNLPNGGVGCQDVKTTFDGTYDYVKCNGNWWTISKDAVNGKIKSWLSLANNTTATTLLNNRYGA